MSRAASAMSWPPSSTATARRPRACKGRCSFRKRALKGRRLAYAMIVEPCEPEIDSARLHWRAALGEEFVRLIAMGQQQGAFRAAIRASLPPAWSGPSWRRWSARWRRKVSARGGRQRLIGEIAEGCLAIVARRATLSLQTRIAERQAFTSPATHPRRSSTRPSRRTGWNAFTDDRLLSRSRANVAPWVASTPRASALMPAIGDAGAGAPRQPATPELQTHDRFGNRIDWVEFHPAWHELMALASAHEVHSLAWSAASPARISPAPCSPTSGTRSSTASAARPA